MIPPQKKNIVFVGDSYCSSFKGPSPLPYEFRQQKDHCPTWLDISAQELNLNLYSFGFSGRSWWYSRDKLFRQIEENPRFIAETSAMVFVHTDPWRFNSEDETIGVELVVNNNDLYSESELRQKSLALKYWVTYLRDNYFQVWAQKQWFKEINSIFGAYNDLKMIHFFSFPQIVEYGNELQGAVFTTPLIQISLGELEGTDDELTINGMSGDQRSNHFGTHNNISMGKTVVSEINNYSPGKKSIDLSRFDIVNPNSHRWPNPGFGTR